MTTPAARGPRATTVRQPARRPAGVPAPRQSTEDRAASVVVNPRDRAVLMAVAAGRCTMSIEANDGLLIDGRPCTDQFAGHRLVRAGLVRLVAQPPGRPHTAELTPTAISLLGLPITI